MTKDSNVIGLDLDDVLASLAEQLNKFHNDTFDTDFSLSDYRQWNLAKSWQCSPEEAINRTFQFFDSKYMDEIKPVEGAQKGVGLLADKHKLVVVTSRPTEIESQTHKWIERYFPNKFLDIVHTNQFNRGGGKKVTKAEVCKQLNTKVFIDDAFHHVEDLAKNQISSYLYDMPWNQDVTLPKHVTRVFNWDEIEEIFK